jgi:outer membrane protease
MSAHVGEAFARIDHHPTSLFIEELIGGGSIKDCKMVDKDFLAGQITFSDTSSDVGDGRIAYGIIDVGVVVTRPSPNARFGAFVGYQYWHDKLTAYGLTCNSDDVGGFFVARLALS